jgi:hypothetical protein
MRPDSQNGAARRAFVLGTPRGAWWRFLGLWVIVHSVIVVALGISGYFWIYTAPCILLGMYTVLGDEILPDSRFWGLTTWTGGMCGYTVIVLIDSSQRLGIAAGIGGGIGGLTLLLIPWRGIQTLVWPLTTTLGSLGAACIVWIGYRQQDMGMLGILLMAGAVYGLLTGPVVYRLLAGYRPSAI